MASSNKPRFWPARWGRHWKEIVAGCGVMPCSGARTFWHRLRRQRHGTLLDGVLYCRPQCLELALLGRLSQLMTFRFSPPPANRMPLGLLMVARGKLSHEQVAEALAAQRSANEGKIGEWFERLGFATEQEVTSTLALQWGCPVATAVEPDVLGAGHRLPAAILESFQMLPLQYVPATNTLSIAFGERVEHGALYAIEKMLQCRTQPCVAGRKKVANLIETLRQQPRSHEFEFGPISDPAEMVRISSSYIAKFGAEEVRLGRFGALIWLRLANRSSLMNLVLRLRLEPQQAHRPRPALLPHISMTVSRGQVPSQRALE